MTRQKLYFSKLKKLNVKGNCFEYVDLSSKLTYRCGGKARYYLEINTLEGLLRVTDYLKELNYPYFILGAGSNILMSDKGYDGVVLKLQGDFERIRQVDKNLIECGCAVRLSRVYQMSKDLCLSGLERSAGIPASMGGAVYMNAGAYGYLTSDVVEYVVALVNGRITYFDNDECEFGYRQSVFQKNGGIILRIGLKLSPADPKEMEKTYKEILQTRAKVLPLEYPSAGCVFKKGDGLEISKMLDECGVKGLTLGDAQVSFKHANFIVNLGKATAQDIYYLIGIVEKRFYEKYKIELEPEIIFLGEFDENTW